MTNLNGFLKRILLLFSFLLFFFNSQSSVLAAANETLLDITYQLNDEGDLKTDLKFRIENSSIIPIVVNYYTISLPYSSLGNLIISYRGEKLERSIHKQNVGSDVVINFESAVIPVDGQLTFNASFSRSNYLNTEKEISSLSFPNNFPGITVNTVQVKFPSDWADLAWSSAPIKKNEVKNGIRTIQFNSPNEDNLNLILGNNLTYGFEINKILTNSDSEEKLFDISIPSWTHSQKILFSKISPTPDLVTNDKEGNTTFSYLVKAGLSANISIEGEVLISESSSKLNIDKINDLLENSGYWKLDSSSEYTRVALYLKNKGLSINSTEGSFNNLADKNQRETFIKEVYSYVINRFSSAQIDESSLENPLRAGAAQALQKEGGVVPEDYVDLTISILRHFGVPARMIVGYIPESAGYKTDGFFHTWLEYWNQDTSNWQMLDPALDDSVDANLYGRNSEDHIAILQREGSSILPKMTYFADSEWKIESKLSHIDSLMNADIELLVNSAKLTSKYIQADLKLLNTGTVPIKLSELNLLDANDNEIEIQILSSLNDGIAVPGSYISIPITISNIGEDIFGQDLKVQYSLTDPSNEKISTVSSAKVEVINYWWWSWLIKLVSFIIFSLGFGISYMIFKKAKKLWD